MRFFPASLLGLCACTATPSAPVAPTLASFDGLPIAYEQHGSGSPPLVFVHGWCGSRALWRAVMTRLVASHRVIALDLGGHGDSGRGREAWTLEACARDVAAVLEGLELEEAILVGHSMGGPVALMAAALEPGRVAGVIGVETLQQVDFAYEPELAAPLKRALERDFDDSVARYVQAALPIELDPGVAEVVVEIAQSTSPEAAVALMEAYAALDARAALLECPVPVRCVNSAEPVATDVVAARRWSPGFEVLLLERTGHFPMVEAPADCTTAIAELLARWPSEAPR